MNKLGGPGSQRIFSIFLDLVRIDSESGRERGINLYIRDFLSGLGYESTEDKAGVETGGDSGNLVALVETGTI